MAEPQFYAGAYRVNITPPLGISMEGTFSDRPAQDVADELFVNALVLADGHKEVAVISVDICSMPVAMVAEVKEKIERLCAIPAGQVLITATHTHAGPALDAGGGLFKVWSDYVEVFKNQIASAVRLAQLRRQPAYLSAGRSANRRFVFPRRLKRPDGSVVMNWIDKALLRDCSSAGVVDPDVLVLRIDNLNRRPICFLVNYANHNNACPPQWISADYSGVMGDDLRSVYGSQLVTLFLPGAAGNVNWIDFQDQEQYSPTLYRQIGKSLAGSVMDADARMEPVQVDEILFHTEHISILERPYTAYDIQVDGTFGPPESAQDFWVAYQKAYAEHQGQPLELKQVPVHALLLGKKVALVTNPVELFTEFGLQIKEKSPYKYTLVAELTDGSLGYVPTAAAFQDGGYEVRKLPGTSILAVDAGDRIVSASLGMLQRGLR